jgi:hypothetical protein
VAVAAAAGAVVAVTNHGGTSSPAAAYVEAWIDAWNAWDAQAVSSMTCLYIPAFVPAGVIETALFKAPQGRPVVADHTILGTEPGVAYGRPGVWVHVSYVSGARAAVREKDVFVRVGDGGELCIGQPSTW